MLTLIYKTPPDAQPEPEGPGRVVWRAKVAVGEFIALLRVEGIEVFRTHKSLKAFNAEVEEKVYIGPVGYGLVFLRKKLPGKRGISVGFVG